MEYALTTLDNLILHANEAEIATWNGHPALKLVDGLAVLEDSFLSEGRIEVTIGTEGAAYPGIAFRISDQANYELGYVQPHTSGQWDAIQYDPVFHGSNTWQLYHGAAYQKAAIVPTGEWFTLRADVKDNQVALTVDDQPPLIVPRLMHTAERGRIGLWTYFPAYFRDLRVSDCTALPEGVTEPLHKSRDMVDEWFINGFGRVTCEANGVLNLNRYLPISMKEVVLTRQFELLAQDRITFAFGFSDELSLRLNDETVFEGKHTFTDMSSYECRGYVRPDQHTVSRSLAPGIYTLTAQVKVTEPIGWGLNMRLQSEHIRLLPVT